MTIRAGVVGSPAKHSLSPLIHSAWLKTAGIDGRYDLFDLAADGFAAFLAQAHEKGLDGVNVTLPFKEQALATATTVSQAAHWSAAANLLVFKDDGIFADNTDGLGLLQALAEQAPGLEISGARTVVLGAGGAARGAVVALLTAGANVAVVNRTEARAIRLVEEISTASGFSTLSYATLPAAFDGADLIVNATSAGLDGAADGGFDLDASPTSAVVMDMVYKPLLTPLLRRAQDRGQPIVDGLAMLIGQARPSFEAFYGSPPPADVDVRGLCLAELERRG